MILIKKEKTCMVLVTVSCVLVSIFLLGENFCSNYAFLRTESMYNVTCLICKIVHIIAHTSFWIQIFQPCFSSNSLMLLVHIMVIPWPRHHVHIMVTLWPGTFVSDVGWVGTVGRGKIPVGHSYRRKLAITEPHAEVTENHIPTWHQSKLNVSLTELLFSQVV